MLLLDESAAVAAIPSMLPADADTRSEAFGLIKEVMAARGPMSTDDKKRLSEVGRLFGIGEEGAAIPFPQARKELQAKAS
jgi:hypothetical protein